MGGNHKLPHADEAKLTPYVHIIEHIVHVDAEPVLPSRCQPC